MNEHGGVSPEDLKRFLSFQGLDDHQLLLLASKVQVREFSTGQQLFEFGDIDSIEYFLIEGALELHANDGAVRVIADSDDAARRQIARLRPRQYTAIASCRSRVLLLDADILEDLQEDMKSGNEEAEAYFFDEVGSVDELESLQLLSDFQSALRQNKFVLPSLPEVAMRVRKLLEDENSNADRIADAVNSDPAIAAKLIRAANSPLYHGSTTCESTRNAIVRLGLINTKQLVVSFTLRDLFQTKVPALKKQMQEAWKLSVEVAAISFVICRMERERGFYHPPEEVMLAGLLHNIGVIAILAYIETHPSLLKDEEQWQKVIAQLQGEAGAEILTRWRFPDYYIEVAREASDWNRTHSSSADICDIVQVAKLHAFMRNRRPMPVQSMTEVPAFHKLPLGELTPELTIRILDEAKDQINVAKQLLNG